MDGKELEYYKSQNFIFDRLADFKNFTSSEFQTRLKEIRDTQIYKFMNLDHVVAMIQNRILWVNRVKKWDDVYENILFKQNFFHLIGEEPAPVNVDAVGNNIFGQCWTFQAESDAMWRIYSPNKNEYAVRVKTTIGKLMDVAFVDSKGIPMVFVGEVSYVDNTTITGILSQYVQNGLRLSSSMREYAELLLLKRKEFEHEKEIRLIIAEDTNFPSDHIELNIDPHQFIEEISLDSRLPLDSREYNHYRNQLLSTGMSSHKINRSTLYDLPTPVNITIL